VCAVLIESGYLASPHAHPTAPHAAQGAHACREYFCIACLLKHAFRRRGFGLSPVCPHCAQQFDEDALHLAEVVT
jgi:hypothetical protein